MGVKIERFDIEDVLRLIPDRFEDGRGFFSETFSQKWFEEAGISLVFQQDNHSLSKNRGVLRGLHFQTGPSVQAKLVRCTRGAIYDIALDIRFGSPTFGRYVAAELTAENGHQLFVPHGFAHAFCTLTENCEVQYKVDNLYDRHREDSILWNDPDIAIKWPIPVADIELSDKDTKAPSFASLPRYFDYSKTANFHTTLHDIKRP